MFLLSHFFCGLEKESGVTYIILALLDKFK